MDSIKLEQFKQHYKELADRISKLNSLLITMYNNSVGLLTVSPYLVSKKLGVDETDAFFLLTLAAGENILQTKYKVWSNDHLTLLGEYEDRNQIPEIIEDPDDSRIKFDRNQYYVEVAFEAEK